ncbi:hypothetical protein HHK36_010579 [Tetracentron sinense]|uniref:Uncharacterized protein n=1 Tax=Tetracentron sinense TaxID=13715 RepID=A0A834Z7P3_TETSI|nr:hypothetical protein HHK36_010579 [Tetracentron sinense]
MDVDTARWILEFLLRQPVDDYVVNGLLSVLPLPNNDLRLKKTILLRRLSSEISNGSVSEKILELLEMIEELDYRAGIAVLESMKAAYCAVAVDCTVKLFRENSDKHGKYFDAVKRIWRGRIHVMERSEGAGLSSDKLKDSREEMEAAVWDTNVCENVLMRDTQNDALKLVRICIAETWENMGPSFLELAARTMDQTATEVQDLDNLLIDGQVGERAAGSPNDRQDLDVPNRIVSGDTSSDMDICSLMENNKENMIQSSELDKHVPAQGRCFLEGEMPVTSKEAEIHHAGNLGVGTSYNKYDCLPSPEINKLQEALKSSSLELRAMVKDPLPDALRVAETLLSDTTRENMNHGSSEDNQNREDADVANTSVDEGVEAIQVNESNLGNQCYRHLNNTSRPGLMERNSTARTFEWDDSIEASSEGSPNCSEKLHLPSSKKRAVSHLKKYEFGKFVRRRTIKKWSSLEEDTLRTAVQKYGKGNWKLILNCFREIFEERTEVDLKDKWRNMIRY